MNPFTHLLVDISNSWTKYCPATLEKLGERERRPTPSLDAGWVQTLLREHPQMHLICSCVVPTKGEIVRQHWPGHQLTMIHGMMPLGFGVDFPSPEQIGADRLANTAAAVNLYSSPAIVIDFGTALTFDVISRDKAYIGGVIAPGLNMMADYLHEKTALLPRITLQPPKKAFGKSTEEAMLAGAFVGYRGLVKEIIQTIKEELGEKQVSVIATGGQAELLAPQIPEIQAVNPLLTLEGLRQIARFLNQSEHRIY